MALQVWLPLNGNLNNQGLSEVTVTNNGMTYTNGKVTSQAGYFTPSKTATINTKTLNSDFSISVWVKADNATTGLTGNILTSTGAFYLRNGATWGNYLMFYVYTKKNDGTYDNIAHVAQNSLLPANIWTHICITKQNNIVKSYVNGNLTNTITKETAELKPITENFVICSGNTREQAINDVRIYDHCLSQKEIKELSKGLCLHYKLSRNGENLLTNSIGEFSGNNTSTSSYKDFKSWSNIVTPESDSWYTTSFDLKGNVNGSYFYQYLFNNSTGRQCDKSILYINGKFIGNYTASDGNTGLIPVTTDWKHIEIVRHFNTNTTALAKTLLFRIKTGTNYTVYIKNVKLEKGNHATPWIPNKSDTLYSQLGYNNIEPDCSGYGNDGTINGTLTYSNDTPRYEGSSYFPTTSNYITVPPKDYSGIANSYSISYWAKIPDMNSKMAWGFNDGNRLNLYPTGNVICCNTGDSGNNPFQVNGTPIAYAQYNNGSWHHYCISGNGSAVILYIDGVEVGRAKTYKPITGTQLKISGWGTDTNFKWIGNISDFRIYATALSAEDVKALYNTPISIDNSKSLHCMELEQTNNQTSFCKSGVAKMELLPIPTITERCAGNSYTKQLKIWANGSQLKLNDVHKIRIIFRSRGDGTPTSSKCSSIGCIMNESSWKWSVIPIGWSSATAYSNIGKIIDYTGSLTVNSTMTSTTTSIPISLFWIIQNGWANGSDNQTHDLYYYKYWNATTSEIYAEGGTPEYDKITTNDLMED